MGIKVMHLMKRYKHNFPLLNTLVKHTSAEVTTYVCYLNGERDGQNLLDSLADEVIYCGLPKKKLGWRHSSTVTKLAKIIDEHKIDVLVCHFRRVIPIGYLAAQRSQTRPKTFGVMHGVVGGKVGLLGKLVNFVIYNRLAKLICVSNDAQAQILAKSWGLQPGRTSVVYNGIDIDEFIKTAATTEAAEPEIIKLIMVGRLAAVKNHARVLEALSLVKSSGVKVQLRIYGNGPLLEELQALVKMLQLDSEVSFEGYCEEISSAINSADVLLLPSLREGFGMALVEAMALAKPVITSKLSGMAEVVDGVECGRYVDPYSVESIADAIKELAELDRAQRQALGEQGRNRVNSEFGARIMAQRYEHLYREALAAG